MSTRTRLTSVVDVTLGPTLRDEQHIVRQFIFRLRGWQPAIPCGFSSLPDPNSAGFRVITDGRPWESSEVTTVCKRVEDLAKSFRVKVTVCAGQTEHPGEEALWDVTWSDEESKALDEEAEKARARLAVNVPAWLEARNV
jgi:hypothetical protein